MLIFFSISTIDILGLIIPFLWGRCHGQHHMSNKTPGLYLLDAKSISQFMITRNVHRRCPMSPGRQNYLKLRATGL